MNLPAILNHRISGAADPERSEGTQRIVIKQQRQGPGAIRGLVVRLDSSIPKTVRKLMALRFIAGVVFVFTNTGRPSSI